MIPVLILLPILCSKQLSVHKLLKPELILRQWTSSTSGYRILLYCSKAKPPSCKLSTSWQQEACESAKICDKRWSITQKYSCWWKWSGSVISEQTIQQSLCVKDKSKAKTPPKSCTTWKTQSNMPSNVTWRSRAMNTCPCKFELKQDD